MLGDLDADVAAYKKAVSGMTVELEDVTVQFGRTVALEGLNLTVAAGETVALLGPSGSGKSTALKAIAGFVQPSRGRIRLAGVDVTDVPPAKRGIGVVVQQYALFPHLRVADNVAFGLRAARKPQGRGEPPGRGDARDGRA